MSKTDDQKQDIKDHAEAFAPAPLNMGENFTKHEGVELISKDTKIRAINAVDTEPQKTDKDLTLEQREKFLRNLKARFEKDHKPQDKISWADVEKIKSDQRTFKNRSWTWVPSRAGSTTNASR